HFNTTKSLRVADCAILAAGGNAIALEQCDGEVTRNAVTGAADNALFCIDSRGVSITANIIRGSGNGGIRVWQSGKRRDGSLIADNRIEDTAARAGGSGENGNAINVFRAADVIVRGNQIRTAAFSAIRGNAASNIQIIGNNCAALDEVAIYSEFDFENALIADNVINEAGTGISVTNFKEGGRLATVRGNVVRNLRVRIPGADPEGNGIGIAVEADTAVTGNVVENAAQAGIVAGWGEYLRDVTINGNVVRLSGIGIAVSVVKGAGAVAIAGNVLAGSKRGAIVGMEWHKVVTGDLALAGAERYPQLRLSGNQVS
ncbi:MAG TPA: TIGR03808 family TAT-translocated repetitive protein, partial [Pseudolabrys sp.]|nr:TIGR03808 family TAT-translocated repetitive protein [Pseudolabrys sp.]